jgi:hypothetical protein
MEFPHPSARNPAQEEQDREVGLLLVMTLGPWVKNVFPHYAESIERWRSNLMTKLTIQWPQTADFFFGTVDPLPPMPPLPPVPAAPVPHSQG